MAQSSPPHTKHQTGLLFRRVSHKWSTGLTTVLLLAAAVKWFELGLISQSKAAELTGLSRTAFLEALHRFEVSPFQYTTDEILAELGSA